MGGTGVVELVTTAAADVDSVPTVVVLVVLLGVVLLVVSSCLPEVVGRRVVEITAATVEVSAVEDTGKVE